MAQTSSTTVSSAIKTKFEMDVQKKIDKLLVVAKFASKQTIEKGEGGTYRVNRLLSVAKVTAADSEGTMFTQSDAKALSSNYVEFTPVKYGDSFAFNEEPNWDSILQSEDYKDVIADQAARSLEYYSQKQIGTNCMRHRVDNDGTYETSGTVDSATATTVVDTELSGTDWTGGYMTFTVSTGPAFGESNKVTAFNDGTDTATVTFTNLPTTSSKHHTTVATGIVAGDKLSTDALLRLAYFHRALQTPTFENGHLRGFLHAAQELDVWSDTTWQNSAIYDESERFREYRLVRWAGISFLIGSNLLREDVDGTINEAGVVHVAPVFGRDAYSIAKWGMGQGEFGLEIIPVTQPDSQNLRKTVSFLSWKARFALPIKDATKIVGLLTGATDMNLLTI